MYLLYLSLLINLGPFDASFVGHSMKNFTTRQECMEFAGDIQRKVEGKMGSALKRIDISCTKTTKPTT